MVDFAVGENGKFGVCDIEIADELVSVIEAEWGADLFAFDEEVEIIAGFDSEVDLLTLFDANISSVFRNDFTRISDVVAENVADKGMISEVLVASSVSMMGFSSRTLAESEVIACSMDMKVLSWS